MRTIGAFLVILIALTLLAQAQSAKQTAIVEEAFVIMDAQILDGKKWRWTTLRVDREEWDRVHREVETK